MPELPEVEVVVRSLNQQGVVGMVIRGAEVFWPRSVGGDATAFLSSVIPQTIEGITRRGKFIVISLENGTLLVHLRMSGVLYLVDAGVPRTPHEQVILHLGERDLRFHDPRKFGRFIWTQDPRETLNRLGPEPLDPSWSAALLATLVQRRRMIKALLLDQHIIAGLGNIYTDEALWHARIHPATPGWDLDPPRLARLARAIPHVLHQGIAHGGTRLGNGAGNFPGGTAVPRHQHALRVFQRAGLPCPRCAAPIARTIVAGRTTHFCGNCQG